MCDDDRQQNYCRVASQDYGIAKLMDASFQHEMMKKTYPDKPNAHGIPYTGLSNARPETLEIEKRLKREKEAMPSSVRKNMH